MQYEFEGALGIFNEIFHSIRGGSSNMKKENSSISKKNTHC